MEIGNFDSASFGEVSLSCFLMYARPEVEKIIINDDIELSPPPPPGPFSDGNSADIGDGLSVQVDGSIKIQIKVNRSKLTSV